MKKCLVVLSGGQDSTTCLAWAHERYDEIHAITFDYGQRHNIEVESAKKVAEVLGVTSHHIVKCPELLKSVSPLLSDNKLEQYQDFEQMDKAIGDRVELTFVPLRNPFFLLIACNHAISLGIEDVVTGVCQSDNANYPDCTDRFISSFENMIDQALDAPLCNIVTPLIYMDKKEICLLAKGLGDKSWEALSYSHTSYDGKYPPTDMNHANVLRAKGFEDAGLPDPLVLRAVREGLMPLPLTTNYESFGAYAAQEGGE